MEHSAREPFHTLSNARNDRGWLGDFLLGLLRFHKRGSAKVSWSLCMSVVSNLQGGEFYESEGVPQQEFADHEFPLL